MNQYSLRRIVPFVTFMAFIGIEEVIGFFEARGFITVLKSIHLYIYPLKISIIGIILAKLWNKYDEISIQEFSDLKNSMTSICVGIGVFALWVNMPWTLGISGAAPGYDPTMISSEIARLFLIGIRLLGAAVVVPIMEELFWRSFVARYIIDPDVAKIPVGQFTWLSFFVSTILFGLEHHLFFAGIMAGAAYNLLLYRTRSIAQCILAHATTNFLLGCYVLMTKQWQFW